MNRNYKHIANSINGFKLFVIAIAMLSFNLCLAQNVPSSSFGNTFIHSQGNLTVFGDHSFKLPDIPGSLQPGIVGAERIPTLGYFNFAPGATWIEADSTKYVDGYVRHFGNTRFLFPIGDNESFRPAAVSGGAYVEAAYFKVDPTIAITSDIRGGNFPVLPQSGPFDASLYDDAVIKVSEYEYWDINGADPTIITLTWDEESQVDLITSNDLERLAIVGWNGAQWEYIPSYIDLKSISLANNGAMFTGAPPDYSKGSISTKIPIIPSSYEVYTLASSCLFMDLDVENEMLICIGEEITLNASSYDEALIVWNTGLTGPTLTDSPTENTLYTVTAILGSCEVTRDIQVEVVEAFVELGQDTFVCSGNDIQIIAEGTPNSSYQWEHRGVLTFGNNVITLQNLNTPSTLNVTITDENGCTATDNVFIDIRQSPDVFTGRDASVCLGDSTFVQAFGSETGYGYQWSTGDTASLIWISPLEDAVYEVSLTENGCTDVSFVQVQVFPQAYVEILNDPIICPGEEIIIETEATSGTYLWNTGDTTANLTVNPLDEQIYSVTLTSPGNCEWTDEISFQSFESTLDLGDDLFICEGESVNLQLTGIYDSVIWNTGSSSNSITVSPTQTTSYTATASYMSCTADISIIVNVDNVLEVNLGPDITICRGESIVLESNAAGQYNWSTGQNSNKITVSPFSTSTYSVTVTSGGCVDEDQITINVIEDAAFVEILTDSLFCPGERVYLQATGSDGDYVWSNGNNNSAFFLNPLDGSSYTVTVTNFSGCTASSTITFESYEEGNIEIGEDKSICRGETVQLQVSGDYHSLQWSNGSTNDFINVSPLATTEYFITATLNGCETYDSVTVNVINLLDLDLGPDFTICEGETAELSVRNISGSFNWSTGQTGQTIELSPASTTTYSVTVTSGDCVATDQITIVVEDPFIEIIANPNYCPGESLLLTANASTGTVLWNNGTMASSITVFPSPGFSYSATIISPNGCTETVSFTPTPFDIDNINLGPDQLICDGAEVNLNIIGNYDQIIWSDGSQGNSFQDIPASNTQYSVTVTQGTCSVSDTVLVEIVESVNLELGPDRTICPGESLIINSNATGIHNWSNGSSANFINVSPVQTTSYYLSLTSGMCTASDSVTVIVDNSADIQIDGNGSICPGESTTLTATGSQGTYLWNNGSSAQSINITPNPGQVFSVTVTNQNGCTASDQITISSFNSNSLDLGDDIEICIGASVDLEVTGIFDSVLWSTGETSNAITVSPDNTSTYSVTVTKGTCQVSDEIDIIVRTELDLDLGPNQTICAGQEIELLSNISGNYSWSTGDTTPSIIVNPLTTSTYQATVTSGDCVSTDEITVLVENQAYVNITSNSFFCLGESYQLLTEGSQGTYHWSNGMTGKSIEILPQDGSTYYVSVTTPNGCIDSDSITMQAFNNTSLFAGGDFNICAGEEVTLSIDDSFLNIVWNDGNTDNPRVVQPSETTSYSATAFYRSCSTTDEVNIFVNTDLDLDLGPDLFICTGESIQLSTNLTGQYSWSTGESSQSINVSPDENTLYSLTITSGDCEASDSILVSIDNAFVDITSNPVFCEDEILIIESVSSPGELLWNNGSVSQNIAVLPQSNDSYSVIVTSENGCTARDQITLTSYSDGDISLGPDITICQGGSTTLSVNGIYDYIVWNDGYTGSTRTVTPGNTRTYFVTSVYGSCLSFDRITVFVEENLNLDLGSDINVCAGQTVELSDLDTGGDYAWSTGDSTNTISVTPLETTSYTVTVSSGVCVAQDEITVNITDDCETDLAIAKSSDNFNPETGDTIELTILLENQSQIMATNVQVEEVIRSGFRLLSHSATSGFYNPNTSIWYIDAIPAASTELLTLTVQVKASGDYFNIAEVMKIDQIDIDSEPGNRDEFEDDYDRISLEVMTDLEDPDNTSEIGDRVWMDSNGDGYQDNSESGLENIEVLLYEASNVSQALATQMTGNDGYFCFTGLSSGSYFVKFMVPDSMVITRPKFNGSNNTNFDDKDSDIENTFGYGTTNMINLEKNQQIKTCDGGLYYGGSIGDMVWEDALGGLDDRYDQMIDSGVEGVILRLYDFQMDTFIRETVTDNNGKYIFDNLKKGDYYIELILPSNLQHKDLVAPNASVDDIDSDFDPFSMKTSRITLGAGQHINTVDAGLAGSLPLTLLDFWGERIYDDELNRLFWSTEAEYNTDYFEIQRSLSANFNFEKIAEVEAAGFSSETLYYTLDDLNSKQAGEYFYRLKMFDFNGQFSYSPIIVIRVQEDADTDDEETRFKIYPIPTTDYLKIEITVPYASEFTGFLVNNLGQHVRTLQTQSLVAGINLFNIDVIDLAQGQYYLNFYIGEEQKIAKVLILD